MAQDGDKWRLIVQVHNMAKALLLKAEEVDPDHEFYYPPLIQQRDALDHIIRAQFALLFPEKLACGVNGQGQSPDEYAARQLDKALGHAYRALFDAGDWLSIIYRERIRGTLTEYSRKTMYSVLPEFSKDIEPRINELSSMIAELRAEKDIGNEGKLIDGPSTYIKLIDELEDLWRRVEQAKPRLDEAESGPPRGCG
ncbi:MAG: hypothetical protein JXQ73_11460 [Phycisphaerae bacterium]|nr:hypothetical protein [Phycisphaerae bacterium]